MSAPQMSQDRCPSFSKEQHARSTKERTHMDLTPHSSANEVHSGRDSRATDAIEVAVRLTTVEGSDSNDIVVTIK